MNKTVTVDVAIFGGGIAGLWLLNRLRAEGYSALLLESVRWEAARRASRKVLFMAV